MRVLLVEDNVALATWLNKLLQNAKFDVDIAYDGDEADLLLREGGYQAIVLDLGLPRRSGVDVIRRLRNRADTVPVIAMTAHDSLDNRIKTLDAGADDYLAKPFDCAELEARLRVQIRRTQKLATPEISCGGLTLDLHTHEFCLGNAALALTPREHGVLEHLLLHANKTVSKQKIWQSVFRGDDDVDPSAVEIYVHRLRRKLEGSEVQIRTLRGLGYMLHCLAPEAVRPD